MINQIPLTAPSPAVLNEGMTTALDTKITLPVPPEGWVWEVLPTPALALEGAFLVAYLGEGTLFPDHPTVLLHVHKMTSLYEIEAICEQTIAEHERGPSTYGRSMRSKSSDSFIYHKEPLALASLRPLYQGNAL